MGKEKSLVYYNSQYVFNNDLINLNRKDGTTCNYHLPNVSKVLNMLEWAGLGFGKDENFRLEVSLKKL